MRPVQSLLAPAHVQTTGASHPEMTVPDPVENGHKVTAKRTAVSLRMVLACVYFRCAGFQQVQGAAEGLLSVVATEVGQSGVGILHQVAQLSAQILSVFGAHLFLSRKHHTM